MTDVPELPGKRFQRRREDFVCERCATEVAGDGYANHCPRCLWSKHVDIDPGDRRESCRGAMRPVAVEVKGGVTRLRHRCEVCGTERYNRTAAGDDREAILGLARAQAEGARHRDGL